MGRRGRQSFSNETMYFITTTIVQFAKVFNDKECCDILVENIKHYQQKYDFRIYAYVIMPSHFHWVIETNPKRGTISDVMRDIKKFSAWDILAKIEKDGKNDLAKLFSREAESYSDQKRKFWMRRFDDKVIRNGEMLNTKIEYIHNNPLKAGLVDKPEDYKYSSARNYVLNDNSVLDVVTDWW